MVDLNDIDWLQLLPTQTNKKKRKYSDIIDNIDVHVPPIKKQKIMHQYKDVFQLMDGISKLSTNQDKLNVLLMYKDKIRIPWVLHEIASLQEKIFDEQKTENEFVGYTMEEVRNTEFMKTWYEMYELITIKNPSKYWIKHNVTPASQYGYIACGCYCIGHLYAVNGKNNVNVISLFWYNKAYNIIKKRVPMKYRKQLDVWIWEYYSIFMDCLIQYNASELSDNDPILNKAMNNEKWQNDIYKINFNKIVHEISDKLFRKIKITHIPNWKKNFTQLYQTCITYYCNDDDYFHKAQVL